MVCMWFSNYSYVWPPRRAAGAPLLTVYKLGVLESFRWKCYTFDFRSFLNIKAIEGRGSRILITYSKRLFAKIQALVHRINHYPAYSVVCFVNTYPLDSDLSGGERYGPGVCYTAVGRER